MAAASTNDTYRPYLSCYHCNQAPIKNLLECEHCESAFYCSQEHGQADWELHKTFCKKQPHDYSKIVKFWASRANRMEVAPPQNTATAASSEKASLNLVHQFHIIKYDETTKALESITVQKMDEFLPMMIPHVVQRLSKLRPDQVLLVTNSNGQGVHNYDGLFIYRLVPEAEYQATTADSVTATAKK